MKIRVRKQIESLKLKPSDVIRLIYRQEAFSLSGERLDISPIIEKVVLEETIGRKITINEAVIFDVEAGEFGEDIKDGIGGALLSKEVVKS